MNKPFATLVLEIHRSADGSVTLVTSIPGRPGTVTHDMKARDPWDLLQTRVLSQLSEFLLLTSGQQQQLDLLEGL